MQFGSMDASLRSALNGGLQEKLDLDLLAGTDGLIATLGNHNVSAVTTFALYLSQFLYGRVDGRYAEMKSDIRVLMGSVTYGHAGSVYQSTAYKSALAVLEQESGGVRVSANIPAAANNKQNAVVRLGMRRDAVQPIWGAVTIIVDEVTKSGAGEIEVTAVMQMNTKILRRRVSGSKRSKRSRAAPMALEVLAGPGCDDVGKEAYIADKLGPDDVVISVGRIFKALTLGADVPSTNTAALRLALGLQTTAIRFARERQLSGFILTGNGNRGAARQAGSRGGRLAGDGSENDRGAGVRGRSARGVRC